MGRYRMDSGRETDSLYFAMTSMVALPEFEYG